MATRLGDMAVGSTVKIKVNGTLTDFIIVQQGSPGSGDNDFDGTWVLMKNILRIMPFFNNGDSQYAHEYLNGTFFNQIGEYVKSKIKNVNLKYNSNSRDPYMTSKVFSLAGKEVGYGKWIEGLNTLAYFNECSSSSSCTKRIAYYRGNSMMWWLRDNHPGFADIACVTYRGEITSEHGADDNIGIRPVFILPFDLTVGDNGAIATTPGITTDATNLGEQNAPFTVAYTATDTGTETLTVTEKLDGEVKQTRTDVAPGTALTVDWLAEKVGYQQVLNGAHTITLEVDNGIISATKTITFTKNVTGAKVSLTASLTADDTITVAALTLEGSFPADMSLTVELTNNALDDSPVWENCTDIQSGESRAFVHHAFTNKTAARGFAFNYKVTIARGASGVGGNITMIGGVIG